MVRLSETIRKQVDVIYIELYREVFAKKKIALRKSWDSSMIYRESYSFISIL